MRCRLTRSNLPLCPRNLWAVSKELSSQHCWSRCLSTALLGSVLVWNVSTLYQKDICLKFNSIVSLSLSVGSSLPVSRVSLLLLCLNTRCPSTHLATVRWMSMGMYPCSGTTEWRLASTSCLS